MKRCTVKNQCISSLERFQNSRRSEFRRLFACASSSDCLEYVDYSNLAELSPSTEAVRKIVGSDSAGRRVA